MAYNYQQVPFWDFVRSFNNGAGVDHPAGGFGHPAGGFGFFGPPGAPGSHPFHAGFPEFGPNHFGHHRGGRGRCGRHHRGGSHERTPEGSRSGSPNLENPEEETREASPQRHGRGHHGSHEAHDGPNHHGRRGGWGGRGGWHGHGRGHQGPPPPFGVPGGFDLSGLIESLSAHPLAHAFRTYTEQAAQRSGETVVPETDNENSFVPPIDIFSTETEYVLHVALPGAKKEDVGVNFDAEKGELNLAGVVYRQGDEEFLKYLSQSERKVGVFERTVKIPPPGQEKEEVDGDAITAKMEDGVLIVTVPKVEKEWTDVKRVDIE